MTITEYINCLKKDFERGNATEHTYRGYLKQLIETIVPQVTATNEPKRISCGAPDYVLTKKDIPVGFIEAKDIGDQDLKGDKKTGNNEQFQRYRQSLTNLIFTDYLDFHLYIDGNFILSLKIGEIKNNSILPITENFEAFNNLIKDFCVHVSQSITSSKKLAEMMAGKARLLSDVIERALLSDEESEENSTLREQMQAFKDILIHDITPKAFADVYAQTIAYGMFAARLHDKELNTFSRQEAAEKIPKSNPFLRKLFGYIAGPDLDDRIKWIVDNLTEIFLAANVEEILKNYGKQTKTEEPIIHFYETFLSEYDPQLRKARGVWYTPAPVVNFIVRAVDDILKTEFNLKAGLGEVSKTKIKVNLQATDKRYKDNVKTVEEEVHRVQILDPATGTGTFLAEIIKHVYKGFEGQEGIWSYYVENHLLPRLNGFELLMASYAMAHLQLDLLLKSTGYKSTLNQRLKVYLTNSLEESHPETGTLFANWLSSEANEANKIKRDTPIMCVIGNPPYSVSSNNKSKWIEGLTADYKRDLNERNIQPLSDDYIKFIRFGQHFIDKNGSGILAYISNNSFIDGIIHRQMRKHLLESFDTIYILDLHGNAKKKEISPDGSSDQNVFDIMQGVSINLFVKTGKKKKTELANVFHYDVWGKRNIKYDFLNENSIKRITWTKLNNFTSDFLFKPQDNELFNKYINSCFGINDLFILGANGIKSERDDLTIQFKASQLDKIKSDLISQDNEMFRKNYNLDKDGRDWKISTAQKDLKFNPCYQSKIHYRPFDYRYTLYTGKSKGFHSYPRHNIHQHILNKKNLSLVVGRQGQAVGSMQWNLIFINKNLLDSNMFYRGGNMNYPLYLYSEENAQQIIEENKERTPNLNKSILNEISDKLELFFTIEKEKIGDSFSPIDILDYIYAILHCPTYRDKYKEFLKMDFPRVPYPKDKSTFWELVKLGGEIREIHLLESPVLNKLITKYPINGDNEVKQIKFETYIYANEVPDKEGKYNYPVYLGEVHINETQYFSDVPQSAWEFYIGGYQPAQKWLKDRKGRTLDFEEIIHYQKIIVALTETDRLMKEIDKIEIE